MGKMGTVIEVLCGLNEICVRHLGHFLAYERHSINVCYNCFQRASGKSTLEPESKGFGQVSVFKYFLSLKIWPLNFFLASNS